MVNVQERYAVTRPMTAKRVSLILLGVSSLVALATFVGLLSPVLFALVAGLFPVALIGLGASRKGRLGPMVWVVLALAVILEGTILGLLLLRGTVLTGPAWLGLPRVAALQLLGLFVLPLVVTGFGYAWTFQSWTLRDEDLERLRARAKVGRPAEKVPDEGDD